MLKSSPKPASCGLALFRKALVAFAVLVASIATAAPISIDSIQKIAGGVASAVELSSSSGSPLEIAQSVSPLEAKVRAIAPTNSSETAFYVVDRGTSGGFVVMSADDRLEPVMVIATSGSFDSTPGTPLYDILCADVSNRISRAESSGAIRSNGWRKLLEENDSVAASMAYAGVSSVNDVRVEPLVQSKWSQSTVSGKNVYNYYTPYNYVCGCVATAGAQILRYFEHPKSSVTPLTKTCYVDGVATSKTMRGGRYAWSDMPHVPDGSITDTECEAIGKLCYDVGVAVEMSWASNGSGAYSSSLGEAFVDAFGYKNANWYMSPSSVSDNVIKGAMLANFDAGHPVELGISSVYGGHAIVGDGYGYSGSTLYIHLNFGWSGSEDAWYNLPDIGTSYSFDVVDDVVYNIFPEKTGELITGRVVGSDGNPVIGATVQAIDGGIIAGSSTTSKTGVYAICVPGGREYDVVASASGCETSTLTVSLGESSSTVVTDYGYYPGTGSVGNSWGNDFTLVATSDPVVPEAPAGVSASDGTSTSKIRITWSASSGASYYSIYRSTSSSSSSAVLLAPSVTSLYYDDTFAEVGTTYYYWVKAANAFGESDFSSADSGWRAYEVPSAPADVSASDGASVSEVVITWSGVNGATSYSVWRSTSASSSSATVLKSGLTATSYSDTSAVAGVVYYYWVKATSLGGTSSFSASDTGYCAVAAPSAPTGVTAADGLSSTSIAVSWNSVSSASSYSVWRATSSSSSDATCIASGLTATSFSDDSAVAGVTYYYWVKASNSGGASQFSASDTGYLSVISGPSSVSATDGTYDGYVRVFWTASQSATSYEIWRATVNAYTSASKIASTSSTSYNDSSASRGVRYYYWVRAVTRVGTSSFSASDSGYRPILIPASVTASMGDDEGVTVTWSSVTGANSYQIGRGEEGATSPAIVLGSSSSLTYVDTTAVPGVVYEYFVRGVSSACTGAWSSSASGSRSIPTPTDLTASDGSYTDCILVTWPDFAGAVKYELMRSDIDDISSAELIATVTGTSYSDTSAEYGLTYYYFLRAHFAAGMSPWSDSEAGWRAFPAPTGVSADDGVSTSRITITWDAIDGATLFQVWRYSNERGRNELIGTSTSTSYNDNKNIVAGVKYSYRVKAVFATGTSAFSSADTGYLKASSPVVKASDGTSTSQVTLTWPEVSGAVTYLVYRSTSSSSANAVRIGSTSMLYYNDTAAVSGVLYYYWVRSATSIDTSDYGSSDTGYIGLPGVSRVSATDGAYSDKVVVSWSSVAGASSYEIWRGASDDKDDASRVARNVKDINWEDTDVNPGTRSWYWVKACDAGPGLWGASDTGYRTLCIPVDVEASTNSTSGVEVSWDAETSGVSFEIYRGVSDDFTKASVVATVAGKSKYTDNTTVPGYVYYYWVRAYSELSESGWSASARGFRAVAPPDEVNASDGTSLDAVTVTWTSATSAKSYEIWRSITTKTDDAELIGATNRLIWIDSAVESGVKYYYWIKSISALDTSEFSGRDVGYVSTPEPTDVIASDGASTDCIRISWVESEGALSYAVWRAESDNVDEASQVKTGITGASYDDTSVTPGKYYWYWVRPVADPGPGVFAGPDRGYASMSAPTEVTATSNNTTRVTVSWKKSIGATSYEIFRAETNDVAFATNEVFSTVTALTYADTNAFPAVKYWYWVRACADADISPLAGPADGFRQLTVPTGVSASDGAFDDHIQITWDETEGAASYEVWRAEGSTSSSSASFVAVVTNTLEYIDTSVTAGVSYSYWLKAVSALHTTGFSSYDKGWRSLYAPETVTASDGATSDGVVVEWSAVEGAVKYEVWRSDDDSSQNASRVFTSSDGMDCVHTNTSAKAGVKYWFWVRTVSATGTGVFSIPDDGFRAVAAPTNLKATDGSSYDYVRVTWGGASGAESYEVLRSPTNEVYGATNVSFSVTGTSFDDTNAVPGMVYRYSVRTISPLSTSDYAGPDEGYRKLQKINDLNASDGTSLDAVDLSWTVPEGAAKCQVWRNTGTSSGSAQKIATVEGGTYSDTTALHGEKYYYWVNAVMDVEGELGSYNDGWRGLVPPDNVVATDGDSTSHVRITWTFSQDATKYEILRGTTGDISAMSSLKVLTAPGELVWEDSTAVPGTLYYYAVRAGGSGGWSEPGVTDVGYKMLMPPSSVAATDGTLSGQVKVTWKSVTGATHYLVYRAESDTAEKTAWSGWQTGTTFTDTSCQGDTKYWYYMVAATDENGSRPSAISAGDSGYAKNDGTSVEPLDFGGGITWPLIDNGDGTVTTNTISYSSIEGGRLVFTGVSGAVGSATTVQALVKMSLDSDVVYTVSAPLKIVSSGTAELDLSSVWGTRPTLFVIGITTEEGTPLP